MHVPNICTVLRLLAGFGLRGHVHPWIGRGLLLAVADNGQHVIDNKVSKCHMLLVVAAEAVRVACQGPH